MASLEFQLNFEIDLTYGLNLFEYFYSELTQASIEDLKLPIGFINPSIYLNSDINLYRNKIYSIKF